MFNAKRLFGYLATGVMPEMTALDESLAEHDKKYHPDGYKEGDRCNKRETMAGGDGVDKVEGKEGEARRAKGEHRNGSFSDRGNGVTEEEDAAYLDAVKRGDMETARRMVREAAAKKGYVYSRFTNSEKPYNYVPWMMFAKDENGDALNNNGYGDHLYLANDIKAIDVENIYKELQSVARELYGKELTEDELNPGDIVISATWMDDMDFVQKLWDDHLSKRYEENGDVPAIKTADGLFVLGEDNSRIKSGDPVTYDDAGQPIPLSRRFDFTSDDIRY